LAATTDDEYLWEPVAGAWSIRRRGDATTSMAAGAAESVADYEYPEPQPPPFTTIAWRMGHMAIGVLGSRAANHFGDGGIDDATTDWPLTAAGGVGLVRGHYDAWVAGVRSLDDDELAQPCGPSEGPWADASMATLVLHITREVIHHGAEICLLRDLYRNRHVWTGERV
jgi:DinB superfamily